MGNSTSGGSGLAAVGRLPAAGPRQTLGGREPALPRPRRLGGMNVIDVLTYGHADIARLIDRLRPRDWEAVALGVWTTKDLVGHLGAFEVRFSDVLASFLDEPLASDLIRADPATFNDDQ